LVNKQKTSLTAWGPHGRFHPIFNFIYSLTQELSARAPWLVATSLL